MLDGKIKQYNTAVDEAIKWFIQKSGMKQKAVAEKAGLTPQALNDMLTGRRLIKVSDLIVIMDVLGIDANDLFGM